MGGGVSLIKNRGALWQYFHLWWQSLVLLIRLACSVKVRSLCQYFRQLSKAIRRHGAGSGS